MDRHALLAAFDEQIRRHPQPEPPDGYVENDVDVTRSMSAGDGWTGVTWCDIDADRADAVIAAQIDRFAKLSRPWEWKHYSYDRPTNLPDRLRAAGFTTEPAEALLVAEIADLNLDPAPPPGVELREVTDQRGVDALVCVHDAVFGGDHAAVGRTLLAALDCSPRTAVAVVAVSEEGPISEGRVEFAHGTDFASLWGGATLPAWRRRGVFRALVAYRAAMAASRGFRYLQVDATPASRPILQHLGFVELATTTPFTYSTSSLRLPHSGRRAKNTNSRPGRSGASRTSCTA